MRLFGEGIVIYSTRFLSHSNQVARADSETADAILARVQLIDTDLNRQLRKGVRYSSSISIID